ncbi:MAG: DUF2959 family protein [Planctomycetota bacterium]
MATTATMASRLALLIALLGSLGLSGCASLSGQQHSVRTTAEMHSYREQAQVLEAQMDKAVATLQAVVTAKDSNPAPNYEVFVRELANTDAQAQRVSDVAAALKARAQAYFTAWESELAAIANPEIRTRNEKRRGEVMTAFGKIDTAVGEQQGALAKFLSDLHDLRKCFGTDLSPAGIGSVSDIVTKVDVDRTTVKDRIDAVRREIDSVFATITVPTQAVGSTN